jgi:branched-subunit amino acid transport protein
MAQPPLPSRYGPPPVPPPRRGLSNVAKFWIGVALCLPAMFVVGMLQTIPGLVMDALPLPPEVATVSHLGLNLAVLAAVVAGLVVEKTRFFVLGVLAGLAVLFVVAAGACILLLSGLGSS